MGTVADVSDLRGENSIIVSYGLKALPKCQLTGIQALIEAAGLNRQGPRQLSYRLLPCPDAQRRRQNGTRKARRRTFDQRQPASLDAHLPNISKSRTSQRQQHEKNIFKQACQMISFARSRPPRPPQHRAFQRRLAHRRYRHRGLAAHRQILSPHDSD